MITPPKLELRHTHQIYVRNNCHDLKGSHVIMLPIQHAVTKAIDHSLRLATLSLIRKIRTRPFSRLRFLKQIRFEVDDIQYIILIPTSVEQW